MEYEEAKKEAIIDIADFGSGWKIAVVKESDGNYSTTNPMSQNSHLYCTNCGLNKECTCGIEYEYISSWDLFDCSDGEYSPDHNGKEIEDKVFSHSRHRWMNKENAVKEFIDACGIENW